MDPNARTLDSHVSGRLNLKFFTLIKKPTKEELLQHTVVFRLVKGGAKQCKSHKTNRKQENDDTGFA